MSYINLSDTTRNNQYKINPSVTIEFVEVCAMLCPRKQSPFCFVHIKSYVRTFYMDKLDISIDNEALYVLHAG